MYGKETTYETHQRLAAKVFRRQHDALIARVFHTAQVGETKPEKTV